MSYHQIGCVMAATEELSIIVADRLSKWLKMWWKMSAEVCVTEQYWHLMVTSGFIIFILTYSEHKHEDRSTQKCHYKC